MKKQLLLLQNTHSFATIFRLFNLIKFIYSTIKRTGQWFCNWNIKEKFFFLPEVVVADSLEIPIIKDSLCFHVLCIRHRIKKHDSCCFIFKITLFTNSNLCYIKSRITIIKLKKILPLKIAVVQTQKIYLQNLFNKYDKLVKVSEVNSDSVDFFEI